MPGSLVKIAVGQRSGQRPVHDPTLLVRGPCVNGGADERVSELDPLAGQAHQPDRLRGGQPGHLESYPGSGAGQHRQLTGVAGRGQQQHVPTWVRQ